MTEPRAHRDDARNSAAGVEPDPQNPVDVTEDPALDPAVDTLARTIYGEARGERVVGKEAVAQVVMNRVRRARRSGRHWWGNTVEEVCRKPWQFSCWNPNDPNRAKVASVDARNRTFRTCLVIAKRALRGRIDDPTEGATHYHARGTAPPWARRRRPSAEIGRHLFYNDIE